jgi:hypothetical protein
MGASCSIDDVNNPLTSIQIAAEIAIQVVANYTIDSRL